MYVLDTNTVAYFFRGEGQVARRLLGTAPRDIAIPAIVAYELRYGVARSPAATVARRAEQFATLLSWVTILPFDDRASRIAADVRAQLERTGQTIGPHDVLIAATTMAAESTLITRNVSEFSRVPGLRIENWFES
jgi:tRNA(fMet)-specific endonuclease VapC